MDRTVVRFVVLLKMKKTRWIDQLVNRLQALVLIKVGKQV
jgi:hypothetical protein